MGYRLFEKSRGAAAQLYPRLSRVLRNNRLHGTGIVPVNSNITH